MKEVYASKLKNGQNVNEAFMIMKKVGNQEKSTFAYIGDKSGDVKAYLNDPGNTLKEGDVIKAEGLFKDNSLDVKTYKKLTSFNIEDFLKTIDRPILDILTEINKLSEECFKDKRCIELNNFFFNNNEFMEKFKYAIGGINQHHNYRGGLAEHTLNVMYLTKTMGERYGSRNLEIAVLGAKLHDIGKINEYYFDRPFQTTLEGDMEGHLVMGVNMLEEAFSANPNIYDYTFRNRIKGIVVQHHGKLEYGSPKIPNSEEAYLVHFADYIDATMNKICSIKKNVPDNTYAPYDKRLETKLFV